MYQDHSSRRELQATADNPPQGTFLETQQGWWCVSLTPGERGGGGGKGEGGRGRERESERERE